MPNAKTTRRTTLRSRLMLATTLLSLGVLLMTGTVVYLGAQQVLRVNLDDALRSIADTEIASASDGPGGRIHVHEDDETSLTLSSQTGYEKFAQIENSRDRVIARTPNLMQGTPLTGNPRSEARARRGRVVFADAWLGDELLRCIYYPFKAPDGRPLLAIIGIPQRPMQRSLQSLLGTLLFSLLIGGGAAAMGANYLARRLTQPLQEMAAAARAVGASSLHARIPAISPDAEIQDVTTVLNEMLARLEAAFAAQQSLMAGQRRFVADASHELRSPLSNLRGTVEVALRRPRSVEDYRDTLAVSLTEIERLSRIVAGLLTLSRADAGQFARSFEPCDLAAIAAQAVAAHAARAAEAGVHLSLAGPENLCVTGDGDRLREVVDNLLDNALRYAPPQTSVTITMRQDGENCCLTVEDAGAGLDEAEQTRIFDRFYRADASRARQSGGLGLGLAIVKAIVEGHRGEVSAQNRPEGGAVFTVRLPATSEESAATSSQGENT